MPSSRAQTVRTQSSPKAWVIACLVLLVSELLARSTDPKFMLPVMGKPEYEYRALSLHIAEETPCDLCLVGSSRVREGIRVDRLEEIFKAKGVQAGEIANYGTSLAGLRESLAIIRRILEREQPRAILLGLSVHPFTASSPEPENPFMLWRLTHWWQAILEDRTEAWPLLPVVLQTEADLHSHLHRYRKRPIVFVSDALHLLLGHTVVKEVSALARPGAVTGIENPYKGGALLSDLQPGVSLADGTSEGAGAYLDRLVGTRQPAIHPDLTAELWSIIQLCARSNVPLILFEVPLSRPLTHAFGDAHVQFIRIVKSAAFKAEIPFITVTELGVSFNDSDFLEVSHLNRKGAVKLSRRLGSYLADRGLLAPSHPASELPETFE